MQVIPRPTQSEIAQFYRDDFDHFAPYLEQIDVHRKYFLKKLREIPGKVVLDIGCALGIFLEEATKQGREAWGIDVSLDAVRYCRKKGLRVSQTWPAGKRFDVVTAFEVIEHEGDPLGMMKRVYGLLKKGGVAVLTTPNHDSFWRKIMGKHWVGYRHPEHINFLDTRSLTELFRRAGFSNITVRKDTPRPFPLSFLFTRSADYFGAFGSFLRAIGRALSFLPLPNPINPWDDITAVGVK